MATETFAYTYILDGSYAVNVPESLGSTTIDSGADATLDASESFSYSGGSIPGSSGTFEFASGDGFVFSAFGSSWWVTNTEQGVGTVAGDDGESYLVCFLAGTLIATPGGAAAIETLRAGDLVLTSEGEARPVRWLARQTVSRLFADPLRVLPIRFAAGALDENLPQRDLYVSPDHALLVGGLLVQAGALVNGGSIARHAAMPSRFVYYHVELAEHALILAEGVAAETFVDNVTRRAFDNWRDAPAAAPIAELELPRVKAWRQVPQRLRDRLAKRAAALGLAGRDVA